MSVSEHGRSESIRHRLRNIVRERGEDVQFALQRYAIERFLYRLGISGHRNRFVLKGATLFALWGGEVYRPTRDLDFTVYGSSDPTVVLSALRDICDFSGGADGLVFDADSLTAEQIRDGGEYQGLRIRFEARLGESHIPLQIDIGFGNAIEPPPQESEYPTFFSDPPPRIRTYPPEAVVSEKLHAVVLLGERNSRYKDFYDLCVIGRQFSFAGARLARAVQATFDRRRTPIGAPLPAALNPLFYADVNRAGQWRAYVTRNVLPGAPEDFALVGGMVQGFLSPLWDALARSEAFTLQWPRSGPWGTPE
ncbi:MAG: nucleotidyl transferase AbiEii/AbiGii toxin family protein [Thermodesulfobacteriota bacterium]